MKWEMGKMGDSLIGDGSGGQYRRKKQEGKITLRIFETAIKNHLISIYLKLQITYNMCVCARARTLAE